MKLLYSLFLGILSLITVAFLLLLAALYIIPRPQDTTDTAIFKSDGAEINYCNLPVLDGSGKQARDIPKAYTPACGWAQWPLPVLASCTEPLARDAADMRGVWHSTDPTRRHVERIEQCGNRVVITTKGVIHDFRTDGTLANGSRDIEPPTCMNTWAAIEWHNKTLNFRPFGGPVVAVTRKLWNDYLLWSYPNNGTLKMERKCHI